MEKKHLRTNKCKRFAKTKELKVLKKITHNILLSDQVLIVRLFYISRHSKFHTFNLCLNILWHTEILN